MVALLAMVGTDSIIFSMSPQELPPILAKLDKALPGSDGFAVGKKVPWFQEVLVAILGRVQAHIATFVAIIKPIPTE